MRNMHHDGSNSGRGLPLAPMVSALTRYRGYHRAWPLLVVVAVYASLAVDAVAQGSVATDRAALVALYDATGGEAWWRSTNWKTAAPLGEWYGVTDRRRRPGRAAFSRPQFVDRADSRRLGTPLQPL